MEIDHSIRTGAVNYANRPQFNQYLGKGRTANPPQYPGPNKVQRNYHIGTEAQRTTADAECQEIDNAQKVGDEDIPFEDYLETLDKQEEFFTIGENGEPDLTEMSDIHFLD